MVSTTRVVALFAVILGSAMARSICGENEILSDGSQWEHTCELEVRHDSANPSSLTSLKIIDENFKAPAGKCICIEGLVRDSNSTCVTRIECEKQMCEPLREKPFETLEESSSSESFENKEFPQCREGETCAVIRMKVLGNTTVPATADRWTFAAGCY
uniref:EB domain-containing protein n=1 Tax=Steinernema glaseri TaxID=37863 RepID=A0A1I7Y9V7_9BILA